MWDAGKLTSGPVGRGALRPRGALAKRRGVSPTRRSRPRGRTRLWLALVLLPLLLLLAGFGLFALTLPGPAPAGVRTDGAVVLTGGTGRLLRGAQVLEAGLARRLLVSGVDPAVRPHELRVAMDLPWRLFAGRVDMGFSAENTRTNAEEVAQWVARYRLSSVRIITSDYHAPRARAEIAARLPSGVTLLVDAVPSGAGPTQLAREYGKLLLAWGRLLAERLRAAA